MLFRKRQEGTSTFPRGQEEGQEGGRRRRREERSFNHMHDCMTDQIRRSKIEPFDNCFDAF
jgi:hypothetical protein